MSAQPNSNSNLIYFLTCHPPRVNSVTAEGLLTTLDITPIEWSMIPLKMSVEFGRLSTTSLIKRLDPGLVGDMLRRDVTPTTTTTREPSSTPKSGDGEDGADFKGLISIQPDIKQRLLLFPPPTVNLSLPFDIPSLPQETKPDPGLTVTCVDCTLKGVLYITGTRLF